MVASDYDDYDDLSEYGYDAPHTEIVHSTLAESL